MYQYLREIESPRYSSLLGVTFDDIVTCLLSSNNDSLAAGNGVNFIFHSIGITFIANTRWEFIAS